METTDLQTKFKQLSYDLVIVCLDMFLLEQKKLMEQDKEVNISYDTFRKRLKITIDSMSSGDYRKLFGQLTREAFIGETNKNGTTESK